MPCLSSGVAANLVCHGAPICREFNKNLVRPRTNTEVGEFKRKKKGKKGAAGDDALGTDPVAL